MPDGDRLSVREDEGAPADPPHEVAEAVDGAALALPELESLVDLLSGEAVDVLDRMVELPRPERLPEARHLDEVRGDAGAVDDELGADVPPATSSPPGPPGSRLASLARSGVLFVRRR